MTLMIQKMSVTCGTLFSMPMAFFGALKTNPFVGAQFRCEPAIFSWPCPRLRFRKLSLARVGLRGLGAKLTERQAFGESRTPVGLARHRGTLKCCSFPETEADRA